MVDIKANFLANVKTKRYILKRKKNQSIGFLKIIINVEMKK